VGYTFALNTAGYTNGEHLITVAATNSGSSPLTGTASVTVTVTGGVTAPAATPYVDIDTPGGAVSGTIAVSGWAIGNASVIGSAITSVQVNVDGAAAGTATYGISRPDVCGVLTGRALCPYVGYTYLLNTAALANGTHTITVLATNDDATPLTGSASITVTVTGGATPAAIPTVDIDTPTPGSGVSGTIAVNGWAVNNSSVIGSAIASVQVKVDGAVAGTATYGVSRPDVCNVYTGRAGCPNVGYTFSLNTAAYAHGTHTITVVATNTDPSPLSGSAGVTVTF
jgi:hypothetical protein